MHLFLLLLLFGIPTGTENLESIKLIDLQGKSASIQLNAGSKATVIFFLSPECPLCESYSLNIQKLQKKYQQRGFQFIVIIPGKEFSKEKVIAFRNKYLLKPIPFYFDPELKMVNVLKASITPEVFVLSPKGKLIYSGRIDNWAYELGRKRTVISSHDLKSVIEQLDQNKYVKPYQTKAVGCFIH